MTYIDKARALLESRLPGQDDALLDLYLLLLLAHGERTTLAHVHDAWGVWRSRSRADHKSIIPFEKLDPEVQELDRKYMEAIRETASELNLGRV